VSARYPITLDVDGKLCVVLGGDGLACAKAEGLLQAGARVTVLAEVIVPELTALVEAGGVSWLPRSYRPGDLEGVWLAIDAGGDEGINRAVWEEAEQRGVLLNVLDRPQRCHFTAPAIVRRGPLQIAIGTTGESPFLASALRARLERLIGEEWGPFVGLVGRVRHRLRERGVPLDAQTLTYRRLLRSGVRRKLCDGDLDGAEKEANAIEEGLARGRVTLVGAGPGDAGLITVAGMEALAGADVVFHDALIEPATLRLCGADAELVDVGKRCGRCNPEQEDITTRMVEAASAGREVVRLKGGDPFVFGRGGEELAGLLAAGIDVALIPGVSSAVAAPAMAGIPLTLRGVASSVAFTTGHGKEVAADEDRIARLAGAVDTLVVLMPVAGLEHLAARLAAVRGSEHPAALVCEATLPSQHVIRSTLEGIALAARNAEATTPATLVVGAVVDHGHALEFQRGRAAR